MASKQIERILVPVALTHEGQVAIEEALMFNKVFGSKLIIVNIIHEDRLVRRILSKVKTFSVLEKANRRLEEFVKNIFGGIVPDFVKLQVRQGSLIPTIIQTSKEFSTHLIIIKKSHQIIGRFAAFRTHNADKLIGQSFCPVLTITENFTHDGIKEIMIPVDITRRTDDKIKWAAYLAKKFNARVTVVSVLSLNIDSKRSLAYQKALTIEEELKTENINCRVLLITETSGKQYDIFLNQVENANPDLIVIMTHEDTLLFSEYIGSFARAVIHKAKQPVFNVVPKEDSFFKVFEEDYTSKTKTE